MRHPASRAVEPKIPLMFKFYSRSLCRRFYRNPELLVVEGGLDPPPWHLLVIHALIDPLFELRHAGSELLHVARAPRRKLPVDPLHLEGARSHGRV